MDTAPQKQTAIQELSYQASILKAMCLTNDKDIANGDETILRYYNWLMGCPYHSMHSHKNFKFDEHFLDGAIQSDHSELAGFLYNAYPYLSEEQRIYLKMKWAIND